MLERLMSTVVVLVLLACGATISMEAMGLIFLPDPADPEDRAEAVVAQMVASLDPRDVPSEAEAEGLWPPPPGKSARSKDAEPVAGPAAKDSPRESPKQSPKQSPAAADADGVAPVPVVARAEPEKGPDTAPEVAPVGIDETPPETPPAPKLVAADATPGEATPAPADPPKTCGGACRPRQHARKRVAPPWASASADDEWATQLWDITRLR